MSFVVGPVSVRTPASSANLGPGFDALGLALSLYDEMTAEVLPEGLEIRVTGEGEGDVPLDEEHLVVVAMNAAFDLLGERPPGLRLTCVNAIPHGRGLGSSAAAIVGGIVLARELVDGGDSRLDDRAAYQLAADLEGHPDNVAAAMFGGLTIAWIVGVAVGYFANGWISFRGHGARDDPGRMGIRFVAVNLIGYALNSFWVWLLVERLSGPTWWPILPNIVLTPLMTFWLHRRWTFS